jgi:hypothetical protein
MTVFPLGEESACFFLPADEQPEPENCTLAWAKSLMYQAFARKSGFAEVEAYRNETGLLLFVRQGRKTADFAALLRQEILTGHGILIVEDFEGE